MFRVTRMPSVLLVALVVLAPRIALAATATQVAAGDGFLCVRTADAHLRCFGRLQSSTVAVLTWPVTGEVSGAAGITAGVDAGEGQLCIVTTAGGARCMGQNYYGQLGDGTTTDNLAAPADVAGLTSGVAAVSAGIERSCALLTDGSVKCWGDAVFGGALGDGTTNGSTTPVAVVGIGDTVKSLSAGRLRTCVVTTGGGVKCWGQGYGVAPTDVAGLTGGVAAVTSGLDHDCALTDGGAVKCWGGNTWGQLGDGTNESSSTPVDVVGLSSGVVAIDATGQHTCALLGTGAVRCWGRNDGGQLGDGTRVDRSTPVDVVGVAGMAGVAAGRRTSCALAADGSVKYWDGGYDFRRDRRVAQNVVDLGPPACTILGPGQIFAARPTPRINQLLKEFVGMLTASGEFSLPPGVRFADLDPIAHGVRFEMRVASGEEHADIAVAGGAYDPAPAAKVGWKRNSAGTSYTFLGGSLQRISLIDRGHGAPGGRVQFKLSFREGFPIEPGEEPAGLTVVLGDDADGAAGLCGQSAFVPGDCTFNEPGTRLKCKK